MSQTRINKEYEEITNDKTCGFKIKKNGFSHYECRLDGPMDTVYENGHYFIDIKIPSSYPFSPPIMKFINKIWHPNISSVTGVICLDILKNEWTPALTIRTALLSIQALLSAPEPDDPQDAVVANMYKDNKNAFEKKAREWTKKYANCAYFSGGDEDSKEIKKLMEMGFDKSKAKMALEKNDWNVERSLNYLIGGAMP